MIILGLTGSIGMGKTTTGRLFSELGIPVNDADEVVHDLYRSVAVAPIETAFPGATQNGMVDRARLSALLSANPEGFETLEQIVHPLVREREAAFLKAQSSRGAPIVVLDIPLLFETGGEDRVDAVIVVTCDPAVQRARVLSRPGMTEDKLTLISARQMPDSEKRKRADYLIDTGHGLEVARQRVEEIVRDIQQNSKA